MPGIAVQAGIHEIGLALAVVLAAWLAGRLLEAVILFVVRHFLGRMVVLIGGVLGLAIAWGQLDGSAQAGLGLGVIEGFTRVFYPEASSIVVFVIMAIVLMIRPAGLFGKEA